MNQNARFALLLGLLVLCSCAAKGEKLHLVDTPRATLSVSDPFCASASSCLLGRVTRASHGKPVSGAAVFVESLSDNLAKTSKVIVRASSNLDGFFAFENLAPGSYVIEVYGLGERELGRYTRHFTVKASGVTFVEIRLASLRN